MFACNVYDLNDEFEANILAETADNVKRIRHHACLGLWCGNNEMEWGWRDWGRLEGHRPKYKADYTKIFEMLLPRLVKQVDDQTYYWLSSPSSGGSFDDRSDAGFLPERVFPASSLSLPSAFSRRESGWPALPHSEAACRSCSIHDSRTPHTSDGRNLLKASSPHALPRR